MTIDLKGKRAVVTGGSSGIGETIVRQLAGAGAKVGAVYRSHPESAKQLVDDIRRSGGEAVSLEADVSDSDSVGQLFAEVDRQWGGIDILVNNAGMDGDRALSWEIDFSEWKKVLEVNLFGAFRCAQEALKRMVRQRSGVIVGTSSVHETIAWSGYSAYTASKAAFGMMTKTLAQEAAPYGVRVVAVAPGAIKTPINRSVWDNPEGMRDLLKKIPLSRIGEPADVAQMVLFLASDFASYVTGQTIYVDGGMTDYPDFAHGG